MLTWCDPLPCAPSVLPCSVVGLLLIAMFSRRPKQVCELENNPQFVLEVNRITDLKISLIQVTSLPQIFSFDFASFFFCLV